MAMNPDEVRGSQPYEEQAIIDLEGKIGTLSHEMLTAMRNKGGLANGVPADLDNIDFTVISTSPTQKTRLLFHSSGAWSRERDGDVSEIGTVEHGAGLGMLIEYAAIVSPHELTLSLKGKVSVDTMLAVRDTSVAIGIRRGIYAQQVGPHVRAYVEAERLSLLERLYKDTKKAHKKVTGGNL